MLQATAHLDLRDAMARTGPGRSGVPVYEAMIASKDFHEGIKALSSSGESQCGRHGDASTPSALLP